MKAFPDIIHTIFEIDKVTSKNTYVQYVGIWKT